MVAPSFPSLCCLWIADAVADVVAGEVVRGHERRNHCWLPLSVARRCRGREGDISTDRGA
jgi:hypothetical protein